MGERRKRKSLWDTKEETNNLSGMRESNSWTGKGYHSSHDSGRYHDFSASGNSTAPNSRDHSGWPSCELVEENPIASMDGSFIKRRQNAAEEKEIGGRNRYYKNLSPGFDGMELHNYNRTLENDRSHSRGYLGRGRSRSRSRSRTRGRSHSRSLSRGRVRERGKGWSRSRSRSTSDGSARGQTRSRSPIGDFRHQSCGWSDRRSGPDKSSQICRGFAAGSCRRGSQCRFFHPNNKSRGDGDLVGDDTAESWRNRADHSRISKHFYSRSPGFDLRDDVSDPYHGEDEQFLNKRRSAVPCKDFMKGKCRWGDTCRFSHHFASDETFDKGTRNTSFDKDIEHQPYKNGKPLCKFFAAGKCNRDNCRFSHEDPKLNNLDGRRGEVTEGHSSRDRSNQWSGPTWNDVTRISDLVNPPNMNSTRDTANAKHDDGWGHSLENDNKSWGISEWADTSLNRDKRPFPPGGSGSYGGGIGTTESIGEENMEIENMDDKQEHLILHGLQLQNQDGNSTFQGQNTLQEDVYFSMKAWQQKVSPVSRIQQQHHAVVENNLVSSFGSDVVDEVKDSKNTTPPILFSGQNLNQIGESVFPGHSSISSETDRGQNMLCPNPSNGFTSDLSGPETHLVAPLNLQTQMQNHQKAVQTPGMLETKVPQFFLNLLASEHPAQTTNTPVSIADRHVPPVTKPTMFLTQRFVNEQSQKSSETEISSSRGMAPSFSDTLGHVPLVNTTNVQSNVVTLSLDLITPMENGGATSERGNHNSAQETEHQMQVERMSPFSIVGTEFDNSKVNHSKSPKLKQDKVVADSELDEGNRAIGEESKDVQTNKHSETLEGHGKVEEGSGNKDEKGMRIFKSALVEFVKEILKPTWKEGRMSREVHKTIVKKVVDKVTSTIQADHIPKAQDKVEQYLSYSKPKITKLIQAYVGRSLKTDS